MIIKKVALKNFRNHLDTTVSLSPGINILIGDNAQGKTNLLEAIYLTCIGRGWRSRLDKELINFDKDFSTVKTNIQKAYGNIDVEIRLSRDKKKSVSINKIPIAKMGELLGTVNCVFFSPDELRLIKEAPSDRRKFMDIDISQIDKNYFYELLKYNKTLAQRNALLKAKPSEVERSLDIWDEQLVKSGGLLIQRRLQFVAALKKHLQQIHSRMSDDKERIDIEYEHCPDMAKQLAENRIRDLSLGNTSVGPHRDDLLITLNGKDVRKYASQGQQRSAALSLKLCQLQTFKDITNEAPIVLFDDVFSELDDKRQSNLLQLLSETQAILTTTHKPDNCAAQLFNVQNGQIDIGQ